MLCALATTEILFSLKMLKIKPAIMKDKIDALENVLNIAIKRAIKYGAKNTFLFSPII